LHGWPGAAGAAFLPGALAGVQLAGLIFFLNPDLPFGPLPVLRGAAVYGLGGGLVTLLLLAPLVRRAPRRVLRWLPWGITAALALPAVLDWVHASHFTYFFPPGINVRLIKAGLLLTLAALIAFYTALLHTLNRRPYGPRSQLGYLLLMIGSIFVIVERREAFRPVTQPSPRPAAVEAEQRPRLLLVALEAATLDALLPAAGRGRLPFFDRALEEGAYGRLESLGPSRRRLALWTTLATGKYPYKHGVVSEFTYPAPWIGPGARLDMLPSWIGFSRWGTFGVTPDPVDSDAREALALWEMLTRLGVPCGLIGWPGSAPAPERMRFAIADRFFDDPRSEGTVQPLEVTERARLFRLRGDELDPVLIARFGREPPPQVIAALADDLWRESLASFLLEQNRDLGATVVQLRGLTAVSEAYFGGYAAARLEGIQEASYQEAAHLLEAYYAHLDQFLDELWRRTPPPKLLAVVSAQGVRPPGELRRAWGELIREPAQGGRFSGSPDGVLVLYGEGIRAQSLLTGAQLVDLVPTLLYGLGFPVAQDLDGRVLTSAFDRDYLGRRPLSFLPSYETLEPAGPRSTAGGR